MNEAIPAYPDPIIPLSQLVSAGSTGQWERVEEIIEQGRRPERAYVEWARANRHIPGNFQTLADLIIRNAEINTVTEDESLQQASQG